jgi:DNA-directed DNA polymerase III PolC
VRRTFVPLRVRSHGSLLHGVAAPGALIGRALELGYDALALTDLDNLYLAVAFLRAARREGLRPIVGAEVTPSDRTGGAGALLLPLDRRGWANLCAILTARHLDPEFDLVRALAGSWSALHVVVESPALAAALLGAGLPAAEGAGFDGARPLGRGGGVWMGLRGLPSERPGLAERVGQARRLRVPIVATGDCTLLDRHDHDAHRVAVTAAAGELLERMPPSAFCAREAWLAGPAEWVRRVRTVCAGAGVPEAADAALANNLSLAERCRLELEMGTPIFPKAPVPAGESGPGWLERLGREGVERRYGGPGLRARHAGVGPAGPAHARLREELAIIDRLGFTDYFLLVAEIVEFARARGIPTVGRGSGAGSIMAYCLGITNVDPLRYGLYFERFLHPSRRDCPDLDIDLCWKRRDEVIGHVYETYGHDRVAMIATHATLGARSAFRETAKALGLPHARVNALAKRVPRSLEKPYLEQLERLPEARGVDWREAPLADALRFAERLEGAPRHLSIHCGGIVIADRPLTYYLPLQRAAKDVVISQFEMRAIEQIGLVKMDLLGNRALTTIGECTDLARGRGIEVDLEAPLPTDAAAVERLAAGDTLNCFQLESPAMRHLLRMLEARTLDDTIAAVALIRPGAAAAITASGRNMKEVYCRRQRGLEPDTFSHPRLESVLRDTHGLMLYEEDVMRVASALTGLPLAQGDDLRRAIGSARGDEEFRALEQGFVAQAVHAGVQSAAARDVWRDLTRFASYAFCKAHAAGYGTLGWHSVRLKTRFPDAWAVGVLNHHAGMYSTWVHVEDLRRCGVRFLAPCVNESRWETMLQSGADPAARRAVRVGLGRVFGLAEVTGARIVAGRPYRSLADFVDRVRPSLPEAEALILAGALDWTARSRPSLLLEARLGAPGAAARPRARPALVLAAPDGTALAPEPMSPVRVPELPEFDRAGLVRGECRATGLWFTAHPLDVLVPAVAMRGAAPAGRLEQHVGRRVMVVGMPCATRRIETRGGGTMLFLTLADRSGLGECVLFPEAWRAHARAVHGQVLRVSGAVDETLGALSLNVEKVEVLA